MLAARAKQLLQSVVGARQVGNAVAVEQTRPVASRHLVEVIDRRAKRAGLAAVAAHSADQPVKAPAHDLCRCTISVAEDVRGGMDPAIGALDVGPQMRGALKPASDQSLELGEPRRERAAPFCATRSKLLATFSNRCSSFSPAAASGVRPSSVIAERTAAP